MSQQHLQCSWVWAGTSGHAPSRETGPPSHPRPAAPRCCMTSPGSACAFAPRGCGWCSAPRPGTATPSPSGHRGRHLHAQHGQKWWIYVYESVFSNSCQNVYISIIESHAVCLESVCWLLWVPVTHHMLLWRSCSALSRNPACLCSFVLVCCSGLYVSPHLLPTGEEIRDYLESCLPVGSYQTSPLASCHHKPVAQVKAVTPTPAVMTFACFARRILVESKHFCGWLQALTKDMTHYTAVWVFGCDWCAENNLSCSYKSLFQK